MSTTTNNVVDSAKFISDHSKYVSVNLDAIDKLADKVRLIFEKINQKKKKKDDLFKVIPISVILIVG